MPCSLDPARHLLVHPAQLSLDAFRCQQVTSRYGGSPRAPRSNKRAAEIPAEELETSYGGGGGGGSGQSYTARRTASRQYSGFADWDETADAGRDAGASGSLGSGLANGRCGSGSYGGARNTADPGGGGGHGGGYSGSGMGTGHDGGSGGGGGYGGTTLELPRSPLDFARLDAAAGGFPGGVCGRRSAAAGSGDGPIRQPSWDSADLAPGSELYSSVDTASTAAVPLRRDVGMQSAAVAALLASHLQSG